MSGLASNPVIVVARNGLELTFKAVESICNQRISTTIILVNNKCTDGTREWAIANKIDRIISFGERQSVAHCWNRALSSVFHQWPYALVVNNDVELRPETYCYLLADGGLFVTARGVVYEHQMTEAELFPNDRRPHPDFGCFLIRRECWQRVGAFDENFAVAYCEDNDYHCRMHVAGIDAYSIGVPFWHKVNGTIRSNPDEADLIHQQAEKNRAYFERKWGFKIPPDDDGKYAEFFRKSRTEPQATRAD